MMEKVEMTGCWLEHSPTTLFILIPKNVTSERPIALLPAFVGWWGHVFSGRGERNIIT